MAEMEAKIKELEAGLAKVEEGRKEMEAVVEKLEGEKNDIKAKLEDEGTGLTDLEAKASKLGAIKADLEKQISGLQDKVAAAEDKAGDATRQKRKVDQEMEALSKNIADIELNLQKVPYFTLSDRCLTRNGLAAGGIREGEQGAPDPVPPSRDAGPG